MKKKGVRRKKEATLFIDRLIVQSSTEISFQSQICMHDEIRECGEKTGVNLKLVKTIDAERTFIWEASYQEKKSFSDMIIAIMKLHADKKVEPGILLDEIPIVGCYQQLNALKCILKNI